MNPQALVIVDTNVVVAGLITADAASPVARLLDTMLAGRLRFVLSEDLLHEYRRVLLRPALCRLHGLGESEVDGLLTELTQHGIVLVPDIGTPAPDPGDQLLWNLLAARDDLLLVTGDKRLLADAVMADRVMTPRRFFDGA